MTTSRKFNSAWSLIGLLTLLGLGAINIFLPLIIVPQFEQIFQDALLGQPLPNFTVFIISAHIPIVFLALIWPLAGTIAFLKHARATIWIIYLGIPFFFLMIVVTIIALFMPLMDGRVVGMSDAPLTSPASSH